MFQDREDAAVQLAEQLKYLRLRDPLVLAIPRGGVVTGDVLARELGAELDIVFSRKLRAPFQHELALGAVSEDGDVYLNSFGEEAGADNDYLQRECKHQMAEIERRKKLFRSVRPAATVSGRSVIITDDGIATGATMLAALHVIKNQHPREVIVAVPVASPQRLQEIRRHCNRVVCLLAPEEFWAIGQFYRDFSQVEDETVVELLRHYAPAEQAANSN